MDLLGPLIDHPAALAMFVSVASRAQRASKRTRTNLRVFQSSQTYIPTKGLISALVFCTGGGGGGGGISSITTASNGGGGGGAGVTAIKLLTAAQIGPSQAITVGLGGSGGAAGANNGLAGGTSQLGTGTLVLAVGGAGGGGVNGIANVGNGSGAVTSGIGDIVLAGASGGFATLGNTAAVWAVSGYGAPSFWGGGAPGQVAGGGASVGGQGGINPGSGGSGAWYQNVASQTQAGGAGANGIVVILEFIVDTLGVPAPAPTSSGIGDLIDSTVLSASAFALTSGTPLNVTNITLPAGDWDVWGSVWFNPAATTNITLVAGTIGLTSATFDASPAGGAEYIFRFPAGFVPASTLGWPVGRRRFSFAAPTTVFLMANAAFTVSTCGAYGYLGAQRVR